MVMPRIAALHLSLYRDHVVALRSGFAQPRCWARRQDGWSSLAIPRPGEKLAARHGGFRHAREGGRRCRNAFVESWNLGVPATGMLVDAADARAGVSGGCLQ